jgi:hypothetical protein
MSNSEKFESESSKDKPFYCKDCYCGFNQLHHYNYHLESKKHKNRISNKDLYICSICKKHFLHSSSLYRHRAKCKEEEVKEIPKIDLETEIRDLRKKIDVLEKKQNTNIENQNNIKTQNNNNNTNIKTQNNIIINCFGNENLDYITDKVIIHCMNKIYGAIPLLIEKIHFDPEHPENHNIQIPNKKLPHAKIMNNKREWQFVNKKEAIDTMVDNGYNMLDEKFQEKSLELPDNRQKHFRNFQSKYEDGDKDTIKDIKDQVEMLVINKSKSRK